jgi:hypothetical protein
MPVPTRIDNISVATPRMTQEDLRSAVGLLTMLSVHGLGRMYQSGTQTFPQTARRSGADGGLRLEGINARYTAIAALGLAQLPDATQKQVLAGDQARDILATAAGLALAGRDPGAVALATWAAAETRTADVPVPTEARTSAGTGTDEPSLLQRAVQRLLTTVRSGPSSPTVDHSWTLTALVAAMHRATTDQLEGAQGSPFTAAADQLAEAAQRAAGRLMAVQGPGGLFPHHMPPESLSRLRAHVGCFADQVYPIQALARYASVTGDSAALAAANRCADRICALQGDAGQWWWHYDSRGTSVVEEFPVYSVHQHAMAPMALFELREAGGDDHATQVALGLSWIMHHPESDKPLVEDDLGVVWRKIGRRERGKVVRKARSALTALRPGLRLEALDALFPPGPIDLECRPYELGWLLYAWHSGGTVETLRQARR